jgi:uncharacterized protein (DUF927 family)
MKPEAYTTPASPVHELLAELETQAKSVTLATYQDFLRTLASLAVDNTIDGVQQNAIVAALVANGNELGGKRIISNALNAAVKQLKRDQKQSAGIRGGQGEYLVKDGWIHRVSTDGEYIRVCTEIAVMGRTRNTEQGGWGKLLHWQDGDNVQHKWAMPMRIATGESKEVTSILQDRGVTIMGGSEKFVIDFLKASDSDKRLTCVDKTGWHNGRVFVTPSKAYGDVDGEYIYQGAIRSNGYMLKGTLEGWRGGVPTLAKGNSRLTFAISSAFAPSLLAYATSVQRGGIQFTGNSKDGKTIILRAAASVWGYHEKVKRSWSGTANGIETTASQHNDGWLFLDELKRASGKEVDRVIYMLSDGTGKAKQKADGDLRDPKEWRLLWMSSGELSATDHITQSGGHPPAGIELRQADVPADAGKGLKIHDTIQDYADLGAFNAAIGASIEENYGVAGDAWLAKLCDAHESLSNDVPRMVVDAANAISDSTSPQTRDVLYRFALIAVAGELATECGLTGWTKGDATAAAKRVFTDWLNAFGGDDSNREHRQVLEAVESFLFANITRFQGTCETLYRGSKERVGFVRNNPGDDGAFLVPATQLTQLADGYSREQIITALRMAGKLNEPSKDGKNAIVLPHRDNGKQMRGFVITL